MQINTQHDTRFLTRLRSSSCNEISQVKVSPTLGQGSCARSHIFETPCRSRDLVKFIIDCVHDKIYVCIKRKIPVEVGSKDADYWIPGPGLVEREINWIRMLQFHRRELSCYLAGISCDSCQVRFYWKIVLVFNMRIKINICSDYHQLQECHSNSLADGTTLEYQLL